MAAPSRTIDPDLNVGLLKEELEREPFRFDFFQMVRLLKQAMPDRDGVGEFVNPANEVVRFSAHTSIAFPAASPILLPRDSWPTAPRRKQRPVAMRA